MVVGGTRIVSLLMRKLQLDMLVRPALFMQDGGGYASKAVSRHPPAIAETIQREQKRIVAHRFARVLITGEDILTIKRDCLELFQDSQRLSAQRNNMRGLHFHPLGRNIPARCLEIELRPAGAY